MNRRHFLHTSLMAAPAAGLKFTEPGTAGTGGFRLQPELDIIPASRDPAL
jgi:hypothetical protein